jgi:D-serine deaminase-like pyridoxal phosphate-dependent protein
MTHGYGYYRSALDGHELPLAFLDLDALDENIEAVRERADGTPVRVASKSVRCRWVLDRVLDRPGFAGVLCYSGYEAAFLAAHGFSDLLVAYPVVHPDELDAVCEAVAEGTEIALVVDSTEHVARAASAAARAGVELPLCIDLDVSTTHLGVHFGIRRSPIRTPETAVALADAIEGSGGTRLAGVMGYEAQIAGLPDESPAEDPATNAAVRLLKRRSKPRIRERRGAVVAALEEQGHDLVFVNGGGTGSVEFTVADPAVTEVTAGSGLYAPRLFDFYDGFQHRPAAAYAVEVTRRPAPDVYTCRGGGYVASGPAGVDKAPHPTLPAGVSLLDLEGAGEVQTPVEYAGNELAVGDPVLLRHAKAGELCRSFRELHLIEDGVVAEAVPTYRGDGNCFL